MMDINLKALEALDAVVTCGGFHRAAEQLHRVQSAVSHQVANLERQLGLKLLNRDGYRVQLTPAGEAILAEGRHLLRQAERLRTVGRQLAFGWEAELLVVVDGILPISAVLEAVRTLANEDVPTRIQVRVEFLRGVQEHFNRVQGSLMLAAEYHPDTSLQEEALPDLDTVLCVSAVHPLARARAVSLQQLQDQLELSVQHSSTEQLDDRHLFGCQRRVYLSSFQAKRDALLLGVGFGWMPLYLVLDDLRQGRLCELGYEGGSRHRFSPRLVYRAQQSLGPAGMRFKELVRGYEWPDATWPSGGTRLRRPRRRSARAGP
jgi:DNA-binding transcriptional LysR family regulator